jgi:hypothetical protein
MRYSGEDPKKWGTKGIKIPNAKHLSQPSLQDNTFTLREQYKTDDLDSMHISNGMREDSHGHSPLLNTRFG